MEYGFKFYVTVEGGMDFRAMLMKRKVSQKNIFLLLLLLMHLPLAMLLLLIITLLLLLFLTLFILFLLLHLFLPLFLLFLRLYLLLFQVKQKKIVVKKIEWLEVSGVG